MVFNPSQTTIQNAELAAKYGIAKAVPSSGGARRTFYTNANIGGKLRIRINAARAQGYPADNMQQIEYFEKVTSPEYIEQQQKIAAEKEAARLAEIARLELIAKNDQIALDLWNRLESERIAKEQAEIKRLAKVKEDQRLAEIQKEQLRLALLEKEKAEKIAAEKAVKEAAEQKEKQRIEKAVPLISSLLPLTGIGILLLYSRGGKF